MLSLSWTLWKLQLLGSVALNNNWMKTLVCHKYLHLIESVLIVSSSYFCAVLEGWWDHLLAYHGASNPEIIWNTLGYPCTEVRCSVLNTLAVPLLSLFPSGPGYHITASLCITPSDNGIHLASLSRCVIVWEQQSSNKWPTKLLNKLIFGQYASKDLF